VLEPKTVFPVFFVIWIALGILGLVYFNSDKSVAEKRRYFPRFVIGAGALFALVVFLMVPWGAGLLFAPFVVLVTWMNLRMTRFCDCGRVVVNQTWWRKMIYCPFCGKKLDEWVEKN